MDDPPGARQAHEEELAIYRKLAVGDPTNVSAQNDVAGALSLLADDLAVLGDVKAARAAYEECLGISRRLVAIAPGNAEYQFQLALILAKLAYIPGSGVHWSAAVAPLETMERAGTLTPAARALLAEVRRRAAKEKSP
jgi:tetratricopeptide (TPR) repeat protein